jgi:NADH-quinone oxidoreductase subunit N
MSAPMLWMVIPLLAAGVGWLLRRWPRIMQAFLTAVSFLLALLAWQLRIDAFTVVGPWTVKIESTLTVLGRNFSLLDSERGLLVFVFLFVGFWMVGLRMAACRPAAGPAALSMAALLIAARSVEPFLFSALLVELAVLASIPALIEPGQPVPQGVLRYLIFQTLAVPFILLAGWAATEAEVDPTNRQLLVVAAASLTLGLSFWLAVFPFYTWVPMLFSQVNPYFAALILTLLPVMALFLFLDFFKAFTWLQALPQLPDILRLVGIVMVASAGIWAAFERNIYRLIGYAVVMESGFSLLALSLGGQQGQELLSYTILPRVPAVGLAALALAILRHAESEGKLAGIPGLLRRYPVVSIALVIALFSLSGLPLFAGFPVRQALYESLAAYPVEGLNAALWSLLASLGLLVGALRLLTTLVGSTDPRSEDSAADQGWHMGESGWQQVILIGGIILLVMLGLFPGVFLPVMTSLLV